MSPLTPRAATMSGLLFQSEILPSLAQQEQKHGRSDDRKSSNKEESRSSLETVWTTTSPLLEGIRFLSMGETESLTPESMPTETDPSMPCPRGHRSPTYDPTPSRSRQPWNTLFSPSPNSRGTDPTWTGWQTRTGGHPSEGEFHYDPRIFGYSSSQNPEDIPYFIMHGIDPLPDSPLTEVQ